MSGLFEIDPTNLLHITVLRKQKNSTSRYRSQSRRAEIQTIESKPSDQRTDEEQRKLAAHEERRAKKNSRSRERMEDMKMEVDRILRKPTRQRSIHENKYVDVLLRRNIRKNQGDTLRIQEDLKLPPLSRWKGPVYTTAHLQMNKIYKEYGLRNNEPQDGETPTFEKHCHKKTGLLNSDSSVIPITVLHQIVEG